MADTFRDKAAKGITTAKTNVSEALEKGRIKASDAAHAAKVKANDAAQSAKVKANKAAETTRAGAKQAAAKTAESVDRNPIGAIVGGLALGAIVAALLPRTAREDKIAGDVGRKVRKTAKSAATNARDVAKEQLDALGVNADAAKGQLRDLVGRIGEAASSAGSAAADTIRKR